jgi:ribose transport system ATP-binding protein
MTAQTPALKLERISKSFPGVKALTDVSFTLMPGEVRALVGENGAGKSTLMRVLSGAHWTDEGKIELFGETITNPTPASMITRGVAVIYQELAQAPHLTVAENVLLGHLPRKGLLVDWAEARKLTKAVTDRLGFDVDAKARVGDLSVAKRQMVEIARALARNAKIIVLDEPSAVLAQAEIEQLFKIIKQLSKTDGVSFAYISHRLNEVFEISDTVTILRDGKVVYDAPTSSLTTNDLIRNMVGREVGDIFPSRNAVVGDDALVINDLAASGLLKNANLKLRKGEIVGLFGLAGAGRTELLRAVYGADPREAGRIAVFGEETTHNSPRQSIAMGLGLVPEDRKSQGLFLVHSVGFNIMASSLGLILKNGFLSLKREAGIVDALIKRLRIKTPNGATQVQNLSGGNQQKCVLARYVGADCKILLSDEPTRGVDVGAKREIYELLVELAETRGVAVLMASSELPEIMGITDRIYVMREGRITAELVTKNTTEEEVMRFATLH